MLKIFFPWKWILGTIIIIVASIVIADFLIDDFANTEAESAAIGTMAGYLIAFVWFIASMFKLFKYKKMQNQSKDKTE